MLEAFFVEVVFGEEQGEAAEAVDGGVVEAGFAGAGGGGADDAALLEDEDAIAGDVGDPLDGLDGVEFAGGVVAVLGGVRGHGGQVRGLKVDSLRSCSQSSFSRGLVEAGISISTTT